MFNFYCEDDMYYIRYRSGILQIYKTYIHESNIILEKTIGSSLNGIITLDELKVELNDMFDFKEV